MLLPPRRRALPKIDSQSVRLAMLLAAFFVVDGLASRGDVGAVAGAPWNPAPGFVLAAAHLLGLPAAAMAMVAAFVAGLAWHGGPATVGTAVTLAQAACWALAGLWLRRLEFDPALGRPRHVVALLATVAAAALVAAIVGPLIAFAGGSATGPTPVGLFFTQIVAGASVLPLVIIAGRRGIDPWQGGPSWETVVQIASLVLLSWEIFGQFVNEEIRFFYLLFLPIAWIATRHGVSGAAAALAATYAALMMSHHLLVHEESTVIELQIRMLALASIGLLLGAIVSDRRNARDMLQARQAELAHVLRLNIGWEMASGLAHELNQPLTAAMSYTEAGIRLLRVSSGDLGKAASAFGKALDQIEQAGEIINRLRDFMKKGEMRLTVVDITDVIDDAVHLAAAEAAGGRVAVQVLLPPHLPPAIADKTQIVQIIINLLRNAFQSILTAGVAGGTVQVSAFEDGDELLVSVRDNGPGVDAAVRGRLFEPFVTTKSSGMGLGLSLSKSIIEAHGGRLWLEAGPGGAAFKFTLPIAPKDGAPDAD